jgi:hypothetical protein
MVASEASRKKKMRKNWYKSIILQIDKVPLSLRLKWNGNRKVGSFRSIASFKINFIFLEIGTLNLNIFPFPSVEDVRLHKLDFDFAALGVRVRPVLLISSTELTYRWKKYFISMFSTCIQKQCQGEKPFLSLGLHSFNSDSHIGSSQPHVVCTEKLRWILPDLIVIVIDSQYSKTNRPYLIKSSNSFCSRKA